MASAYLEADLGALYRLAELHELVSREGPTTSRLTAIQHLEDRFGLSPRSRQVLQWQVLAQGEAPSTPLPDVVLTGKGVPAGSVRRLRAVDPASAAGS